MTDKLTIYNGALRKLGQRKIASLSENREPRRVLDDIWSDDPIKRCLEAAGWQWATRSVKLTSSDTLTPAFGYSYAFDRPTDWIRTVSIATDEYFRSPINRFADENGLIFADHTEIYLRYVSDDTDYGRDYSRMPSAFVDYLETYMAFEACLLLTGGTSMRDRLEREVSKRLSEAVGRDGINRPTQFPPPGQWASARHGSFNHYQDERSR